jgi:opacity protein-like surface antigen
VSGGNAARPPWLLIGFALACSLHTSPSVAQQSSDVAPGQFEVSAGTTWVGSALLGSRDATLTGSSGDRFRLFSTSSELGRATGFNVRLGRHVTGVVEAEVSASYASPLLTTSIVDDAENATATAASEAIRQFTIEGGALFNLLQWRLGARVLPFVAAGGGYLRQLHEGNALVQAGKVVYVGGGARIPLVSRGADKRLTQLGVRVDLRALLRSGGVMLDGKSHISPALSASLFVRF